MFRWMTHMAFRVSDSYISSVHKISPQNKLHKISSSPTTWGDIVCTTSHVLCLRLLHHCDVRTCWGITRFVVHQAPSQDGGSVRLGKAELHIITSCKSLRRYKLTALTYTVNSVQGHSWNSPLPSRKNLDAPSAKCFILTDNRARKRVCWYRFNMIMLYQIRDHQMMHLLPNFLSLRCARNCWYLHIEIWWWRVSSFLNMQLQLPYSTNVVFYDFGSFGLLKNSVESKFSIQTW